MSRQSGLPPGRSTVCPCGGAIEPQIVGEHLIDYCTRCQRESVVDVVRPSDFVRYDQRPRLEAHLIAKAADAKRPARPVRRRPRRDPGAEGFHIGPRLPDPREPS